MATACAPRPPTLVVTGHRPEAPMPTLASALTDFRPPKGPVDPPPPRPTSESSHDIVAVPVPAAPDPTPDMVRDLRRTVVNVKGGLANKKSDGFVMYSQVLLSGAVLAVSSQPHTSPYRPRWVLSAAEGFVLLYRVLARDPARANAANAARRGAIRYYQLLLNDYPRWCAAPHATDPAKSAGCADETLYYLALEQERDGDITAARVNYSLVIRDWPTSPFVPSAHLALGELLFDESDTDPSRLPLAEQSYLKTIKYPPPDNVVYGYAQLRLGHVCLRRGHRAKAVKALRAAIAWAKAHPSAVGGGPVAAEATEALARLGVH